MKGPRLLASTRMVTKVLENWRSEEKTGFWLVSPGTRHLCATDYNTLSCVILIYILQKNNIKNCNSDKYNPVQSNFYDVSCLLHVRREFSSK